MPQHFFAQLHDSLSFLAVFDPLFDDLGGKVERLHEFSDFVWSFFVVGHHKLSDFLFGPFLLVVQPFESSHWKDGHSFRLCLFLDESKAPSEG